MTEAVLSDKRNEARRAVTLNPFVLARRAAHWLRTPFLKPEFGVRPNESFRDAWLQEALAAIPAGSRILDAGAGELKYKPFCSHLDYVSQDFAQYDGVGDREGLQPGSWDQSQLDIISDITNIPSPDASFDAIMCVEVIEHVPHPIDALKELVRLLRPGGVLILTAPFCALTHFSPYFYQTGYSRYFYEYWLPRLDVEIVELRRNGNYFDWMSQELSGLGTFCQEHIGIQLSRAELKTLKRVEKLVDSLSQRDSRSDRLLCFGVHVIGRKRTEIEQAVDAASLPSEQAHSVSRPTHDRGDSHREPFGLSGKVQRRT